MDEKLKQEIANFRFSIIGDFVTGVRLSRGEREKIMREKAERKYDVPGSHRTRVSKGTIEFWIAKYRAAGNNSSGLLPMTRHDKGESKTLSLSLRMALRDLKQENPDYTLPTLIAKLREKRLLEPDEILNSSTCYRFLSTIEQALGGEQDADRRSFEAAYPNAIWQCDVLHGPQVSAPEGLHKKTYLIAIIDDHSRLITHAQFYMNETALSLKDCLFQAVQKRGIPQKFYVDNGSCYRSDSLENTCTMIGAQLVHSRPYIPQGRGKIERFFRTVRDSFLQLHDKKTLSLDQINEKFASWLEEYHNRVHGGTDQTPVDKYTRDMQSVRPAPALLQDYFRECEHRIVRRDRTVQLNGRVFEVPQGLIGKKVELRFQNEKSDSIEVFFQNYSHGHARQVDLHINSQIGRNVDFKSKDHREEKNRAKENPQEIECTGGKLFETNDCEIQS